mmetsp:Transcript_49916/g.99361  ORF Transcript_49916/g.99361 Transcript_49916/m.99361 type:complete len:212 (-) Transcript_49916:240-875(-)
MMAKADSLWVMLASSVTPPTHRARGRTMTRMPPACRSSSLSAPRRPVRSYGSVCFAMAGWATSCTIASSPAPTISLCSAKPTRRSSRATCASSSPPPSSLKRGTVPSLSGSPPMRSRWIVRRSCCQTCPPPSERCPWWSCLACSLARSGTTRVTGEGSGAWGSGHGPEPPPRGGEKTGTSMKFACGSCACVDDDDDRACGVWWCVWSGLAV